LAVSGQATLADEASLWSATTNGSRERAPADRLRDMRATGIPDIAPPMRATLAASRLGRDLAFGSDYGFVT
jgi:hypothetical protein